MKRRAIIKAGVWQNETGYAESFMKVNDEVIYFNFRPDSNLNLTLIVKPSEIEFLN